jgi:poly-gamma-glutamate synthesis protein (capsule biosynthesis protein)
MLSLSKHAAIALLAFAFLAACSNTSKTEVTVSFAPTSSVPTAAPSPTPDGSITIAAVGDVMIARRVTTLMEQHGAMYPFELVAPLLQDADLTIANLENTLTERGEEQVKAYVFRAPPRFASGLVEAGVDAVSLGNNHAADYGPTGLQDTLDALDAVGLPYAGAGMNEAHARRPAFFSIDGQRVALLSYTDVMENTFATADSHGVALATTDVIAADVGAAKSEADIVIVALHSGIEYTDAPQPNQQSLARAAIDAGAALVIGHHPHTLQGVERYGDGLILYSLGNFVFDLDNEDLTNLGPRAFESAVYYVTITDGVAVEVRPEPVFIDPEEIRPRPAAGEQRAAILARIEQLNALAEP